jgi:hypothetical protein
MVEGGQEYLHLVDPFDDVSASRLPIAAVEVASTGRETILSFEIFREVRRALKSLRFPAPPSIVGERDILK